MTAHLPYRKIIITTALAAILLVAFVSLSSAQESTQSTTGKFGIQVSSPIYTFEIAPGATKQDIIKIKNAGDAKNTFYPEIHDFKQADEKGTPNFIFSAESGSSTYSLASWINMSKEPITLEPEESASRNFTISVPKDAEPGGRYAGILFGTSPPKAQGSQVVISNKVGALILVRVAGDAKELANVKEFSTPKNFYENGPVDFTVRVENKGNVHVIPKGTIEIKDIFGKTADTLNVNEKNLNLYPESVRNFLDKDGNKLVWNPKGFTIGRYTASLLLNYGSPAKTLSSELTFWVVPWKILLVILLAVIIAILLLILIIKKYNRWIAGKALKSEGPGGPAAGGQSPPPAQPYQNPQSPVPTDNSAQPSGSQ